jgi:c-di-GMP-binding flagellar brake protein YcgR
MLMEVQNRREFLRADVRFPARYHLLNPQEVEMLRKGLAGGLFKTGFSTALMDELAEEIPPGSEQEPLYRCLQMLNNKLDFIIDQIAQMERGDRESLREVTEISGSGLKFITSERIPLGSFLKMEILVPVTLQFRIEMIVEVVRTDELDPGGSQSEKRYMVAVKIVLIEEDSRDAIIKTVFRRQRKRIRMERAGKGE